MLGQGILLILALYVLNRTKQQTALSFLVCNPNPISSFQISKKNLKGWGAIKSDLQILILSFLDAQESALDIFKIKLLLNMVILHTFYKSSKSQHKLYLSTGAYYKIL